MPPYSLQTLKQKHFRILELYLEGLGRKEIAAFVGMTPEGIGLILSAPIFQDEAARRREEKLARGDDNDHEAISRVREVLEANAEKAVRKQIDLLDSIDDALVLRASNNILDRVLGKPVSPVVHAGTAGLVVDIEHMEVLQVALTEAAKPTKLVETKVVSNGSDNRKI